MENCTLYTHEVDMGKVLTRMRAHFDASALNVNGQEDNWESITVVSKKRRLRKGNTITITYRQRSVPGYTLEHSDEPIIVNLHGMYAFVQQIDAENQELKRLLLGKIPTVNTEIAIKAEPSFNGDLRSAVMELAYELDAFFFSEGNSIFNTDVQGFWDKTGALLLDVNGHSTATNLTVNIEAKYFDSQTPPSAEALERKARSLQQLQVMGVRSSAMLPPIVDETAAVIRTPEEVAQRVAILTVVNGVAFGHLQPQDVISYLQKNQLWEHATPDEKKFLHHPTEEEKTKATWKCESIWVLLWALGLLPELGYMTDLCNLDMVPEEVFPFRGLAGDLTPFFEKATTLRPAAAILDANDLYYRAHWSCVDARLKSEEAPVHPGVVYERHYALNWLINYRNQPWDSVTCDT
ncbi:DUF4272 domain-containing protein [Chitinophaga oryzae]|uniref:DUF4272 domain-containing protein n=1 Tax=Chitinophaga oryzae TaxID=2725414 RepID=A0ABX6LK91_9BACT|nr:DUF4272 domain-containing protein [Chitinophaga oryzae]QJB39263.1 DUF4272 domain-containing protein [Chitinophaga oryzae]